MMNIQETEIITFISNPAGEIQSNETLKDSFFPYPSLKTLQKMTKSKSLSKMTLELT